MHGTSKARLHRETELIGDRCDRAFHGGRAADVTSKYAYTTDSAL
jgi:hypothetical protein